MMLIFFSTPAVFFYDGTQGRIKRGGATGAIAAPRDEIDLSNKILI